MDAAQKDIALGCFNKCRTSVIAVPPSGPSVSIQCIDDARQAFIVLASIVEAVFLLATTLPSHHAASRALSVIYGADAQATLSFLFLLGASIALLGSYIRKACFRELGSLFTFDLTIRDGHKLVTTGPYAIVRHPSYTGLAFVLAGLTICELAPGSWWVEAGMVHTNPGKIIAALWILQVIALTAAIARAPIEDAALRQEFEEEWRAYAHKVPYLYIPSIL